MLLYGTEGSFARREGAWAGHGDVGVFTAAEMEGRPGAHARAVAAACAGALLPRRHGRRSIDGRGEAHSGQFFLCILEGWPRLCG